MTRLDPHFFVICLSALLERLERIRKTSFLKTLCMKGELGQC